MNFCLTLSETNPQTLDDQVRKYAGQAQLIEIRLDHSGEPLLPALPDGSTQWIATCRPVREGGRFAGSESERLALLSRASHSGFDWVDLEWDSDLPPDLAPGTRVVRSRHFLDHTPEDIQAAWDSIEVPDNGVGKLVPTIDGAGSLVRLLRWMDRGQPSQRSVAFGMGPIGQVSRYLGALGKNEWTYVAPTRSSPVAPGQFGLAEATQLRRLDTEHERSLYGVLGNPVEHSLSPALHNHLFSRHGLNNLYLPLCLDRLDPWFDYLSGSPFVFQGFSVTIPFKLDVAKVVGGLSPANTLLRLNDDWQSFNTDLEGFLAPLERRLKIRDLKAIVLGNGGVAHTVVEALLKSGARVLILGRDRARVEAFARHWNCDGLLLNEAPLRADLVVNTTPVGLWPEVDASPFDPRLGNYGLVYDLVYNPIETRLLALAQEAGCQTVSGIEMFAEQAARQFEIWTGISPDRPGITKFLESQIGN